MFVNVILQNFEKLKTFSGLQITLHDISALKLISSWGRDTVPDRPCNVDR
jgi:hypothetical protein